MDLGFDVVVTITGIVLVFLILILLMAIITLEGKIFDSMNAKKKAAKEAAKAPAAQPAAPVQQAAAAPAPQVEEGIPGDVIAAIMAACNGQRQVHPQGCAPQQERLGQCGCKRHHRTVLTEEEEHDTVY